VSGTTRTHARRTGDRRDALVTAAVAAAVGSAAGMLNTALGGTSCTTRRDASEDRHTCILAIIVIELEDALLGFHTLSVWQRSHRSMSLRSELVRLILRVAADEPHSVSVPCTCGGRLVLGLVALGAVGRRVLAVELPAREVVVEALLAAGLRLPAHDVPAATLVLAWQVLHALLFTPGVAWKPLPR